ncbi:putative calcium binding protein [Alphaentomopoxvirus acuprea]|uniref:Putative calcium binding protein n=1 Tax=Alphaentomopoxvirus acuprea TaxID=62099 RepID=W6JIP4_9POXV|nr:putative calcium binding protein [Anomala cuprea entomopoxvirus]BAO49417.1 putative calcium binding protein [Anomala cuprea entomopoxvirus]
MEIESTLNEIFNLINVSNTGLISAEELLQFMLQLDSTITLEDVQRMIENIDINGDRYIDSNEFILATGTNITPEDINNTFESISIDGVTNIDLLTRYYNILQISPIYNNTNEEYINLIFRMIGNNKEDFINFWNFITTQ